MKKAFLLVVILLVSVLSTACINNFAVQELNNKAKDYLNKGDYQNAISRLKSSLDLDSTIFETHYNLGIAYTQAEYYKNAIETFENAIKLKPSFADTYYSLAVANENYAKSVMDGTVKEENDIENEDISNSNIQKAEEQDDDTEEKKELTPVEKNDIANHFEKASEYYQKYLDLNTNAEEKPEILEKIEYLKTQIQKYSPAFTDIQGE